MIHEWFYLSDNHYNPISDVETPDTTYYGVNTRPLRVSCKGSGVLSDIQQLSWTGPEGGNSTPNVDKGELDEASYS